MPTPPPPPLDLVRQKRVRDGQGDFYTLAELMADEAAKRSPRDLDKEQLIFRGVGRWQSVVQEMADALADGILRSAVRPIVGGAIQPVAADLWNTEYFWRRFEEFQLLPEDVSRFSDPSSIKSVGWIFVETLSLSKWLGHPKKTPTGAQGRPTLMPLVKAELARLCEARTIEATLAMQAKVLAKWFQDTHPNEVSIKPSSIERAIRSEYWAARGRSRNPKAGNQAGKTRANAG